MAFQIGEDPEAFIFNILLSRFTLIRNVLNFEDFFNYLSAGETQVENAGLVATDIPDYQFVQYIVLVQHLILVA